MFSCLCIIIKNPLWHLLHFLRHPFYKRGHSFIAFHPWNPQIFLLPPMKPPNIFFDFWIIDIFRLVSVSSQSVGRRRRGRGQRDSSHSSFPPVPGLDVRRGLLLPRQLPGPPAAPSSGSGPWPRALRAPQAPAPAQRLVSPVWRPGRAAAVGGWPRRLLPHGARARPRAASAAKVHGWGGIPRQPPRGRLHRQQEEVSRGGF